MITLGIAEASWQLKHFLENSYDGIFAHRRTDVRQVQCQFSKDYTYLDFLKIISKVFQPLHDMYLIMKTLKSDQNFDVNPI